MVAPDEKLVTGFVCGNRELEETKHRRRTYAVADGMLVLTGFVCGNRELEEAKQRRRTYTVADGVLDKACRPADLVNISRPRKSPRRRRVRQRL